MTAGALASPSRAKTAPALAGSPFAPHYLDLGPARLEVTLERRPERGAGRARGCFHDETVTVSAE